MKYIIIIVSLLFIKKIEAQAVLEYNINKDVEFKIYSGSENILKKVTNVSDFKSRTPEDVVRSYFFATSNNILSNLYFDKEQFTSKEESHFNNIKKTPSEDIYVQLLHKTNYNFLENQMCYIMFIAKIKGIDFPFPTLLSLTKKGENWLIYKRANQQKLTDCLMMFKPCVLSNLIEGKSDETDIKQLISKTESENGSLDFIKLFDELVGIQNNEMLSTKLTMSQNLDCSAINYKETVKGKNSITSIYENVSIEKIKEQDSLLISQIKKNNDSIVLTSKLKFEYADNTYISVKFDRIKVNGKVIKDFTRIDTHTKLEKPVEELIFIFQNFNISIFSDLTPSMNETPIMNSILYKETRGVYDVLNISKLYKLYQKNRGLFDSYLDFR